MNSKSNLMLISLFVLYEATNGSPNGYKKNFYEEKTHHFKEDVCNQDFYENFHQNLMTSNCKPRPTVVELVASAREILLVPSKVMVNRCAGECHAKQTCLASNRTEKAFQIQEINILERTPKCGLVYVEEHHRCSCKCTVMKEHCNEKQEYKPGECMCLCMNDDERKKCNESPGKFWDSDQCICQCHAKKVCQTGLVWVPEHCSCAKLMYDEENEIEDIDVVYHD